MDLLEAKKQYNNLYKVTFADNTIVVFRLLSWKEYEHYRSLYDQKLLDTHDESLFNACVVDAAKLDFESLRAGVVYTITNVILRFSGTVDIQDWQDALEEARKTSIATLASQIEMIICKAFPAYKPEDIWNMGWPMIIQRLAQAESLLLQTQAISKPLQFITDNNPRRSVEELVKDAQRIRQVDQSTPANKQHPVGRESNWSKVRD